MISVHIIRVKVIPIYFGEELDERQVTGKRSAAALQLPAIAIGCPDALR